MKNFTKKFCSHFLKLAFMVFVFSFLNCENQSNEKIDFINQIAPPTISREEIHPQMKFPDKGMSYKNTFEAELTRKVINLSHDVKRVVFDFTDLDSTLKVEEIEDLKIVKEVVFFDGISIEKENLENKKLLFINSVKFKNLLIKYKPESISRIFYPPFDTLRMSLQKKLVKVPDLSLNYVIRFSKDSDVGLSLFPNELRTVKGVNSAKNLVSPGTIFTNEVKVEKVIQIDSTKSE